ncbi:MAG: leucine-rich repeat protein [Muribaculaceae bacterium]|nr:leucine-rich repeat protein [Muribaculaceae bacterium]
MNKKFTLLLLMALFAMTASAYTYYNNIEIGNFKYSYLALGSSSSEENYAFLSGLSSIASTSLTTLNIPGYVVYNGNNYRVKQINQNAFHNNTKITSVTFGYGVEDISSYVFDGCTALKYVNLPSSVKEIGQFVFQNCTSLTVVAFAGEKAPKIYDYTFNLSSTTKKASTATYRGMNALKADAKWVAAFGTDNILRHYSYKVGDFKVYNSTNGCWQYYTIKNGVPYNGNSSNPSVRSMCLLVAATFTDGSNYTISLPQRVGNSDNNAPGSYLFYGVADSAFMGNTSITKITNNNTMAYKIGVRAFKNCTGLQSVDVPVDTIAYDAFGDCSNLYSVNFASNLCNLVYLGRFAFGNCNLSDVTIPQTTKYIGDAPFYGNPLMTGITVDANNPNYCSYNNALYDKSKTMLYQLPGNWQEGIFPETLQRVLPYAAAGCKFSSLYLPYNVKIIDEFAFLNCINLKIVHFPSSVTTIDASSFAGCNAINRVELNLATPPSIDLFLSVTDKSKVSLYTPRDGYSAYANSSIWKQYNRKTGTYDHINCWDIIVGNLIYTVTSNSPYNKNGYTGNGELRVVGIPIPAEGSISIPTGVVYAYKRYVPTEIGPLAAPNTTDAMTITEAPSITTICDYAFWKTKLSNFPFDNVETIGPGAFCECANLKVYIVGALPHLEMIMLNAFLNSGIKTFEVPTSVYHIGEKAFYGCQYLTEIFMDHIDGKHPLDCGKNFFGDNPSIFKCWVDYRRLPDFLNTTDWDTSKIYPHLKLDSEWQSFACVKPVNFEGLGLTAYTVTNFNQSDKKATLSNVTNLAAGTGAVVHGNKSTYYRLNYANSGSTSSYMVGVTNDSQTVTSGNTISYFKLNPTQPVFDKVAPATNFPRGYAYLKLNTSATGGATTIYTNLSGDVGLKGDVNGDGKVNVSDVTALVNMILGVIPKDEARADINGDGKVNVSDVTALINIILGTS